MEDTVDLRKCFETLYQTLDIMIEEYSKMDGFNYIVHKLKRIKEKIGYVDIDTSEVIENSPMEVELKLKDYDTGR